MSERASIPLNEWPDRLEAALRGCQRAGPCPFNRVMVVHETASTQDVARHEAAGPGLIVAAWRQSAGRGRFGRSWHDTGLDGLAMTFVVEAATGPRLALVGAIAAAWAIEAAAGIETGIKWPNDLVIKGRKLAGVLVEQADGLAAIGIGINVHQRVWPESIGGSAISLAGLGVACDRLDLAEHLIAACAGALRSDDERLTAEYKRRDVLAGQIARFRTPDGPVTGRVERVDPSRGLLVLTAAGEHRWLDGATASLSPDSTLVDEHDH